MSRTLGVLGDESVILTASGTVLRVRKTSEGRDAKQLGTPVPGLFDDVTPQSCEGTLYGRCGNSGILNPSAEQRPFLAQTFLVDGIFAWHGAEPRVCCFSCAHPPR